MAASSPSQQAAADRPAHSARSGIARDEQAATRTSTALQAAARLRQLARAAVLEDRHELAAALHDNVGALLFAIQAVVRDLASSLVDNGALHAKAESIEVHAVEAAQGLRESLSMMHVARSRWRWRPRSGRGGLRAGGTPNRPH